MSKEELIKQGKKVLTLQCKKEAFIDILEGRQKIEHRYIYPKNANMYVEQKETDDDTEVTILHYDYLYLINGRRKDAPRLCVEVVDSEFVVMVDENGNDKIYIENGIEYVECQVWYHLGNVIFSENIK